MKLNEAYEFLGVNQNSGEDEIRAAYKQLALASHPSRNKDDANATERFQKLSEACAQILDLNVAIDLGEDCSTEASNFNGVFGQRMDAYEFYDFILKGEDAVDAGFDDDNQSQDSALGRSAASRSMSVSDSPILGAIASDDPRRKLEAKKRKEQEEEKKLREKKLQENAKQKEKADLRKSFEKELTQQQKKQAADKRKEERIKQMQEMESKRQMLFDFCRAANLAEVQHLIDTNEAKSYDRELDNGCQGRSLLHVCIQEFHDSYSPEKKDQHIQMFKYLLECKDSNDLNLGWDDEDGQNILHKAAKLGALSIIHILLSHWHANPSRHKQLNLNSPCLGEDGWSALHYAACGGHHDIIKLLIDYGANTNQLSSPHQLGESPTTPAQVAAEKLGSLRELSPDSKKLQNFENCLTLLESQKNQNTRQMDSFEPTTPAASSPEDLNKIQSNKSTSEQAEDLNQSPASSSDGTWSCYMCTLRNDAASNICEACETPRSSTKQPQDCDEHENVEHKALPASAAQKTLNFDLEHMSNEELKKRMNNAKDSKKKAAPKVKEPVPAKNPPVQQWLKKSNEKKSGTEEEPKPAMEKSEKPPSPVIGSGVLGSPYSSYAAAVNNMKQLEIPAAIWLRDIESPNKATFSNPTPLNTPATKPAHSQPHPDSHLFQNASQLMYYQKPQDQTIQHYPKAQEQSMQHYQRAQDQTMQHYPKGQDLSLQHPQKQQEQSVQQFPKPQQQPLQHYQTPQEHTPQHFQQPQEVPLHFQKQHEQAQHQQPQASQKLASLPPQMETQQATWQQQLSFLQQQALLQHQLNIQRQKGLQQGQQQFTLPPQAPPTNMQQPQVKNQSYAPQHSSIQEPAPPPQNSLQYAKQHVQQLKQSGIQNAQTQQDSTQQFRPPPTQQHATQQFQQQQQSEVQHQAQSLPQQSHPPSQVQQAHSTQQQTKVQSLQQPNVPSQQLNVSSQKPHSQDPNHSQHQFMQLEQFISHASEGQPQQQQQNVQQMLNQQLFTNPFSAPHQPGQFQSLNLPQGMQLQQSQGLPTTLPSTSKLQVNHALNTVVVDQTRLMALITDFAEKRRELTQFRNMAMFLQAERDKILQEREEDKNTLGKLLKEFEQISCQCSAQTEHMHTLQKERQEALAEVEALQKKLKATEEKLVVVEQENSKRQHSASDAKGDKSHSGLEEECRMLKEMIVGASKQNASLGELLGTRNDQLELAREDNLTLSRLLHEKDLEISQLRTKIITHLNKSKRSNRAVAVQTEGKAPTSPDTDAKPTSSIKPAPEAVKSYADRAREQGLTASTLANAKKTQNMPVPAPTNPPVSSHRYPIKPGAENCKYYMMHAECKYGLKCTFNHPPEVLQKEGRKVSRPEREEKKSIPVPGSPNLNLRIKRTIPKVTGPSSDNNGRNSPPRPERRGEKDFQRAQGMQRPVRLNQLTSNTKPKTERVIS